MSELIPIDKITLGDRRRTEAGDIEGLAKSIYKFGLLHPIIVDSNNNLVAGGRRLAACKSLGHVTIPARDIGDLTAAELREIELEENIRRKDLTEYERSRFMVQRAEVVKEISRDEFRSTVERKPVDGRPAETGSLRDVARRLGSSPQTIMRAQQHVAAVEAHPELADAPQSVALDYVRAKQTNPDLVEASTDPRVVVDLHRRREEARTQMKAEQATSDRLMSGALAAIPGAEERMERAALRTSASKRRHELTALLLLDPKSVAAVIERGDIEGWMWLGRDTRAWFDRLDAEFNSHLRFEKGA